MSNTHQHCDHAERGADDDEANDSCGKNDSCTARLFDYMLQKL